MLASPNMEVKVPTFGPRDIVDIWLLIITVGSWLLYVKNYSRDVCWELSLVFLLDTTLSARPKPCLPKVLSCWHSCHTWDLGLGILCESTLVCDIFWRCVFRVEDGLTLGRGCPFSCMHSWFDVQFLSTMNVWNVFKSNFEHFNAHVMWKLHEGFIENFTCNFLVFCN